MFYMHCQLLQQRQTLCCLYKEELRLTVRIGIPSSLLYYMHYPMWHTFFSELGAQVITSEPTNKNLLDAGVQGALADACVPVKIYFGHVISLGSKVDYLFIPRVVCLNGRTIYCPKFLGMPDMLRLTIPQLPPIIDVTMDVREGRFALFKSFQQIGKIIGANAAAILKAYAKAQKVAGQYQKALLKGWHPPEAIELVTKGEQALKSKDSGKGDITLAVLGYPYEVHDDYISVGLIKKLKRLQVNVVTMENIPPHTLAWQNTGLDKNMFWTFSDLVLRATHYIYQKGTVDGVIHLTAFGCGPDSIVDKLMDMAAKQNENIPFMSLSIDEHTGDAGISTRLEAFTDMLRRRKGGQ